MGNTISFPSFNQSHSSIISASIQTSNATAKRITLKSTSVVEDSDDDNTMKSTAESTIDNTIRGTIDGAIDSTIGSTINSKTDDTSDSTVHAKPLDHSTTSVPTATVPRHNIPSLGDFDPVKCRACTDINAWAKKAAKAAFTQGSIPAVSTDSTDSKENKDSSSIVSPPSIASVSSPLPCPPDAVEIGNAGWTLLHTISAYYPKQPTPLHQQSIKQLLDSLALLYPCKECADHLREDLKMNPVAVDSQDALVAWMCAMHNRVNQRLGKEVFDCSRAIERWRDGCN